MATTVDSAFNYFMTNFVNLDRDESTLARASHDWLINQIHGFGGKITDFPKLYSDMDIDFGSFARKTKIRELDDIDLIIVLSAEGSLYEETYFSGIKMNVPYTASTLLKYCHDGTNTINSKKIINKFVSSLSTVPNYAKAEVHRKQEAATLDLKSYAWTFDIVPAFFTKPDYFNKTYYLIPDGLGNWKKTDPRIDKDRVTQINQFHDGNILNVIRAIKYWNKRPTMPSMPSYLLENMILNYYNSNISPKASKYVDLEIVNILNHIHTAVFFAVNDPKGIQGDLNTISGDDKLKISTRAYLDFTKAIEAREFEHNSNHEAAIKKWGEVFGPFFPSFG
ncbi:hypothetical protein [Geotalea toluenoxydans]|uniref:hypothetical protein n=1 Tax=Geotalea toluenoxydans TaxID=421624 RepID=UPI0006D1DC23|nr:hypothetical protein [Geotalea toluenoxydans]